MTSDIKPTAPGDVDAERQNTDDAIAVDPKDTATGEEKVRTTQEVRQGHTGDHVRYILGFSGLGIVIVFAIVYFMFMQ